MGDMLEQMLAVQRSFQRSLGHEVEWMSDTERVAYVKEMYIAAVQELGEALDETSWKPWARGVPRVNDALFGELIDVWHFIMNMFMVAMPKLEPDELAALIHRRYMEKQGINRQRQADGYDGVAGKCPRCRRAYDDSAVKCHEKGVYYFCDETGVTYPHAVS